MATFKVFVDPTTRSDGTHRIRIRAYHRDSRTTINTPYTVGKGEFTKGGKIKDAAIVDKYVSDECCNFVFTLNAYYNMFTGISRLYNKKLLSNMPKELPVFFP